MSFAFLAHPPSISQLNTKSSKLNIRSSILPPPKHNLEPITPRRPSIRRRSATVSGTVCSITTWASHIVPGSPAPLTPRTPRTPPLSAIAERLRSASSPHVVHHKRRRSSASNNAAAFNFLNLLDTPSTAAYISVCTPSPSHLENKPTAPSVGLDLEAQGYTTVFVRWPGTPVTPHTAPLQNSCVIPNPSLSEQICKLTVPTAAPKTPTSKKAFTRLRSLSFKATKKAMLSQHHSSSSSTTMATASKPKSRKKSASSSSTPHARYAHLLAPAGGAGALPLAQEVQLSQMLDGGSVDANVKRVTKRHAKDTGAAVSSKKSKSREDAPGNGVSGVYRDGRGGMFWDEDEAFELAGLLKRSPSSPLSSSPPEQQPPQKRSALGLGILNVSTRAKPSTKEHSTIPVDWVDPTRRGSESAASDASTTRSSSVGSEIGFAIRPLSGAASGTAGGFVPGYRVGMGAVGSMRPGDAFSVPPNGKPGESMGPLETKSTARERPRARHRPAPLTLTSALPAPAAPPPAPMKSAPARPRRMATAPTLPLATGTHAKGVVEEGRKDFFDSSFDPPVPCPHITACEKEQRPTHPPLSASTSSGSKSGRRLSFNMSFGNMINTTARTVRRASASLGMPSPGPLTSVTGKFNNNSAIHVNANASSVHLHSLAYGPTGSTKSRASSSSSKTMAPSPPPLRLKASKLKLASFFHRDKSTKA